MDFNFKKLCSLLARFTIYIKKKSLKKYLYLHTYVNIQNNISEFIIFLLVYKLENQLFINYIKMAEHSLEEINIEKIDQAIQDLSTKYDIYKFSGMVNNLFKKYFSNILF